MLESIISNNETEKISLMLVKSCVYSKGDKGGTGAQDENPNRTKHITRIRNKYFIGNNIILIIESTSSNFESTP